MEVILTLAYCLILGLIIVKAKFFRLDHLPKSALLWVFIIKVCAGIILYLIYSRYYTDRNTADIFKYFDDSKIMYDALFSHPLDFLKMLSGIGCNNPHFNGYYEQMNNWFGVYPTNIYGDGHIMIRFNALARVFSFGYYQVHSVFINFLSLLGITALYRFLLPHFEGKTKELFLAVFLIPSVIFWGSGVLKEGLIFFSLGILLYQTACFLRKDHSFTRLFLVVAALFILRYTKFYIFIFTIPLLMAYSWTTLTNGKQAFAKYLLVLSVFITGGYLIKYLFPVYDVFEILARKQTDFIRLATEGGSGSSMVIEPIHGDLLNIIRSAFYGVYLAVFRPFPGEVHNILMLLSSVENILVLFIFIVGIFHFNKKLIDKPLFFLMLFFCLIIFSLSGIICPFAGALVRYKTPALPFLLAIIIMFTDKELIIKRFHSMFGKSGNK